MSQLTTRLPLLFIVFLAACAPVDERDPFLSKVEDGDSESQLQLAIELLEEGNETNRAITLLEKSSTQGNQEAKIRLANLLLNGKAGAEKIKEGIGLHLELSDRGSVDSKVTIAKLIEDGDYLPHDPAKAMELYLQAANQDQPYALYRLALYKSEEAEDPSDWATEKEIRSLLFRAAKGGIADAYYLLGQMAEKKEEIAKAEEHYFEAAKLGHPQGMLRTGLAYHREKSNPKYSKLGFEYLKKAMNAGVPEAIYPLAIAYQKGSGVSLNFNRSDELMNLAVAFRNPEAALYFIKKDYTPSNMPYETQLKLGSYLAWTPDIDPKVAKAISSRIEYRDSIYYAQQQYLLDQYRLTAKKFLAEYGNGDALTEEENTILEIPYSKKYGEHEELFLNASQGGDPQLQFEMGEKCLDEGLPFSNTDMAIDWFYRSLKNGNTNAGIHLYALAREGPDDSISFSRAVDALSKASKEGNLEASFLLAKHYLIVAPDPSRDHNTIRLLLDASDAGNTEARKLAKEMVSQERGLSLNDHRIRAIIEDLANDGAQRFEYLKHYYTIQNWEQRTGISSAPASTYLANEISRLSRTGQRNDRPNEYVDESIKKSNQSDLPRKVKLAIDGMIELSSEGNPHAQLLVSKWKFFGFYNQLDEEGAFAIWEDATSSQPEPLAEICLYQGLKLYHGYNGKRDVIAGSKWLRLAAEGELPYAVRYFSDLNENLDDPYKWLVETAYRANQLNDDNAMVLLSRHFDKDEKYYTQAKRNELRLYWLHKAAKHSHPAAWGELGIIYLRGKQIPQDVSRGIDYLTKSADSGDPGAQFALGYTYISGEYVDKDHQTGMKYVEMAADQGHVQAIKLYDRLLVFPEN